MPFFPQKNKVYADKKRKRDRSGSKQLFSIKPLQLLPTTQTINKGPVLSRKKDQLQCSRLHLLDTGITLYS